MNNYEFKWCEVCFILPLGYVLYYEGEKLYFVLKQINAAE